MVSAMGRISFYFLSSSFLLDKYTNAGATSTEKKTLTNPATRYKV